MDVYSIGTKVIKAHYISSLWCFISFIIGVRSVCNPCAPAFTFPSFKRFPAPGAQSMAMQCEVEQPEIPPLLEVCPKKETRPPPPHHSLDPKGPTARPAPANGAGDGAPNGHLDDDGMGGALGCSCFPYDSQSSAPGGRARPVTQWSGSAKASVTYALQP